MERTKTRESNSNGCRLSQTDSGWFGVRLFMAVAGRARLARKMTHMHSYTIYIYIYIHTGRLPSSSSPALTSVCSVECFTTGINVCDAKMNGKNMANKRLFMLTNNNLFIFSGRNSNEFCVAK